MIRDETSRIETKRNETKRNETKRNDEPSIRYDSFEEKGNGKEEGRVGGVWKKACSPFWNARAAMRSVRVVPDSTGSEAEPFVGTEARASAAS